MKKLILNIDEEVLRDLETNLMVKSGCGNLFGIQDEFCVKLVGALRDLDCKEITLTKVAIKKQRKKKKTGA